MEFLGWWLAVVLTVVLISREVVWRRRMAAVIAGVRALGKDAARSMRVGPWTPGQLSSDSRTTVRRPDPPLPVEASTPHPGDRP